MTTPAVTLDKPGEYRVVSTTAGTGETVQARCVWTEDSYGVYNCGCDLGSAWRPFPWRYCPLCGRVIEWRAKP